MKIPKYEIDKLLLWFKNHKRDLPWRLEDPTRDPYRVWVSEVMLQQTQVSTVIPYFVRWIKAFPDVRSLAEAKEEDQPNELPKDHIGKVRATVESSKIKDLIKNLGK